MKSAKKISRIAGLADVQQRDLAQSLSSAIVKRDNHVKQIDELKRYRLDYATPLSHGELNSANAQQIVAFISNLNNLIQTLEAQTLELTSEVRDAEAAWIESQYQAKSYNKLARERFLAEQQLLDSREERLLDDAWLARQSIRH